MENSISNEVIRVQRFSGKMWESPGEHIRSLKRYFCRYPAEEEDKVIIAASHLQEHAQRWWEALSEQPGAFKGYERALKQAFWNIEIQEYIFNEISRQRFGEPHDEYTYFFRRQVARLRELEMLKLSESQIVGIVCRNVPPDVAATARTAKGGLARDVDWALEQIVCSQWRREMEEKEHKSVEDRWVGNLVCDDEDRAPNYTNQACPKVEARIAETQVEVVIDSGSQVSVLSERIYWQMVEKQPDIKTLPIKAIQVRMANNKRAKIEPRQVWVDLQIGEEVIPHVFLVMKGLIHEVLVGVDFLHKNQCTLDFRRGEFRCKGTPIKFITTNWCGSIGIKEVDEVEGIMEEKIKEIRMVGEDKARAFGQILKKYREVFSEAPGTIQGFEQTIKLRENQPFQSRSYPVPYQYREEVQRQIEQMVDWGVISKCSSPFCNPLVVVKKKNGAIRICLDARQLNRATIPDCTIPPPMHELLGRFKGKKVFSTFDLTASYWQIQLRPEDRQYTAFRYDGYSYQFNRMPFGLINSGAGLLRCLDQTLSEETKRVATIYIDDVVIASSSVEEHEKEVEMFLKECKDKGIRVNLGKSNLVKEEVTFLGHLVGHQGLKPHPDKISAIRDFPIPRSRKQIRSFLGLCNFYHRFHERMAEHAEPLVHLLRKDIPWKWADEQRKAFEDIKVEFAKQVMLAFPDFTKPFILQTDSSGYGLGATLSQTQEGEKMGVLYFISRLLKGPELNYSATEKEALAIVWAFQKFRPLLLGSEVAVVTDHKSLEFINHSYLTNSRLIRWSLLLQEYNYTVHHCKGVDNIVADILSRNPVGHQAEHMRAENACIASMDLQTNKEIEEKLAQLGEWQRQDKDLGPLIRRLEGGMDPQLAKKHRICHGILQSLTCGETKNWKPSVPGQLRNELVAYVHQIYGHYGALKTEHLIRKWFYWPGIHASVKAIVGECKSCQRTKPTNRAYAANLVPIIPTGPGEIIAIDFYGPLPAFKRKKYLIVAYDLFSKHVAAYPIAQANTKFAIRMLETNYFNEVGKPRVLLSDHGTPFTSNEWRRWIQSQGIKHCLTSIRNPQSNPCERVMRELGRLFRTYTGDNHRGWVKLTPQVINFINWSVNESTGLAPFRLHFGCHIPCLIKTALPGMEEGPVDTEEDQSRARQTMQKMGQRRKNRQRNRPHLFKVGDRVMVRAQPISEASKNICRKFCNLYEGPFSIVKCQGNNAFWVDTGSGIKGSYNARALKPARSQRSPADEESLGNPAAVPAGRERVQEK